jgi:hypothetical protein
LEKFKKISRGEGGFILVLGLAMLVVLTIIGVSIIRSTVIDLKISGNERKANQEFYVVDSSWSIGRLWLNNKATPPPIVNTTLKSGDTELLDSDYYNRVRNYGNGGDGVQNETFSTGSEDGNYLNAPFWYRLLYAGDTKAEEYGEGYRDFRYEIESSSSGRTTITTRVYKIYKVGY